MADGKFLIGKPAGGVTTVTMTDGASNTNLVLPESGTVATQAYVDSKTWKDINYKPTPVTITSWSYSETTITLNVTSHTFVAGDYIEVSGTTATTYAPNGVYLVTSVTPTTIVFTLSATPTGTTGVSSATVKGIATLNGKIIDTSKITQDKSSSRTLSTTYYNTSGKQKHLSIIATGASGQSTGVLILKNGIQVSYSFIGAIAGTSVVFNSQADIENGDSYSVINAGGTLVSLLWLETI